MFPNWKCIFFVHIDLYLLFSSLGVVYAVLSKTVFFGQQWERGFLSFLMFLVVDIDSLSSDFCCCWSSVLASSLLCVLVVHSVVCSVVVILVVADFCVWFLFERRSITSLFCCWWCYCWSSCGWVYCRCCCSSCCCCCCGFVCWWYCWMHLFLSVVLVLMIWVLFCPPSGGQETLAFWSCMTSSKLTKTWLKLTKAD